MRFLACLALAVVLGAAKLSAAPTSLKPAAPWKVDYSANSCILSREFTTGPAAYEFTVTLAPVEQRAWLRIGSVEKTRRRDDGDALVEIDGVKLTEPTHFNLYPNAKGGTTREFLFEHFQRDVGRTAKTLRLAPARHGDFILDIADFPDAMKVMHTCMDDLHHSLGIDPAILGSIASQPEGWSFAFVRAPAGPFDMQLLYWVTVDDRVDECRVLAPSGKTDLDARVCDELKQKGRFTPAKDTAGRAMRAPVYEDIRMRVAEMVTTSPL